MIVIINKRKKKENIVVAQEERVLWNGGSGRQAAAEAWRDGGRARRPPGSRQVLSTRNKKELYPGSVQKDRVNRDRIQQVPFATRPSRTPTRETRPPSQVPVVVRLLCPLSHGAVILPKPAPEHAVNLGLLSLQGLPCFLCSK